MSLFKSLWNLILLFLALLIFTACGGGSGTGPGSDSGPGLGANPATEDSSGGLSSSGDRTFINVRPDQLEFRTFESSSVYSAQKKSVTISFEGDGVLVGYAPDVIPPNWLQLPFSSFEAPQKIFDLEISALPINQGLGEFATSLRLVTGNLDGSDPAFVDLPIRLLIGEAPPIYNGDITFHTDTGDPNPPEPRSIQLDFGAYPEAAFSVDIESANTASASWLSALPQTDSGQVEVAITSAMPAGHYKANLIVNYQAAGATGVKNIPVNLIVTASEPAIHYVTPPQAYINRQCEFIIRGVGFSTQVLQNVTLGGSNATSFLVLSDTEIRARFPAMASEGVAELVLRTTNGNYFAPLDVVVKQPAPAVYGNLNLGEAINDFEFDALRDVAIVATSGSLYRVEYNGNSWELPTQRSIMVRDFALTPDGEHIVYSDGKKLHLLDAVSLATSASYDIPAFDTPLGTTSYAFASVKHVMNNGDVLLALPTSPRETFSTFHLPNKIISSSESASQMTMTKITSDKNRVFIVSNANSSSFAGYYDASNLEFKTVQLPHERSYSNRLAYSGNGERIYLNDGIYDVDFNKLVSITDPKVYNYSAELSVDGNTAYWVDAGNGEIHSYDIKTSPATKIGIITIPDPYSYYAALPKTRVTPDNMLMILSQGTRNASTPETRLVFVPL